MIATVVSAAEIDGILMMHSGRICCDVSTVLNFGD
jgi:hypothetical protein